MEEIDAENAEKNPENWSHCNFVPPPGGGIWTSLLNRTDTLFNDLIKKD